MIGLIGVLRRTAIEQPRQLRDRSDWLRIRELARQAVTVLETDPTINVETAARQLGIGESSVYRAWNAAHPGRTPRVTGGFTDAMRAAARESFVTLCDVMTDHVGRHERSSTEIFAAVRDDYGSVCQRRLWRALARLVTDGRVVRRGQHGNRMYTRARP